MLTTIQIGRFETYKGYVGTIEWDPNRGIHRGHVKLGSLKVEYHAKDVITLYEEFTKSVDDYLEGKYSLD